MEGAHVVGTLLALCSSPSTARQLGYSQAPLCHTLIFSFSKKTWSTGKPYYSPITACFNVALWPSWYGKSCACERTLMYSDRQQSSRTEPGGSGPWGPRFCPNLCIFHWLQQELLAVMSLCDCRFRVQKVLYSSGAKYCLQDANRGTKTAQGGWLSP